MKKRLVTTLLSVIFAFSLALSFTACEEENSGSNENNGNDDQQPTIGVEVTEEQWDLAFERALTATNVTCVMESIQEGEANFYSIANMFFDAEADIALYAINQYIDYDRNSEEIKQYALQENSVAYSINQNFEVYDVYEGEIIFANSMRQYNITQSADITSIDETGYFWDYFSEFEFVEGEYRADNLYYLRYNGEGYSNFAAEIKVKIDSDGYLRYWSIEIEHTLFGQTTTEYVSFELGNYGTTKIEAPQEVLDAVEEYKSKNN